MATIRDSAWPVPAYVISYDEAVIRPDNPLLRDLAFNRHSINDGHHVSPYAEGRIDIGLDNLTVRLVQGIEEESFKRTLSRAQRATIGIPLDDSEGHSDWEEMMKGGLQTALETQTVIFEVIGTARASTHQIVRSRRAAFHQQSMRASFFGNRPNVRVPESVWEAGADVRSAWLAAIEASHEAYRIACEADVSYQDARYILPIGTETYIMCEYPVREFLALYAYRACSMFQWEIASSVREMGRLLSEAHPWLAPYIKISCQDGPCSECGGIGYFQTEWADVKDPALLSRLIGEPEGGVALLRCDRCDGTGKEGSKCTFQGWEQVEDQCGFPWAKEELRTYKPEAHLIRSIKRKERPVICDVCWEPIEANERGLWTHVDKMFRDHQATPAAASLPARKAYCPTCGSGEAKVQVGYTLPGESVRCSDPWHDFVPEDITDDPLAEDRASTPEEDARNQWLMLSPEQRADFLARHPSAVPPEPIRLHPTELEED